jgi:hypothetical protein
MHVALNDKTHPIFIYKITPAIIINFIYYRHSALNVCLLVFWTGCLHPVFFTFLYVTLVILCYSLQKITSINKLPLRLQINLTSHAGTF